MRASRSPTETVENGYGSRGKTTDTLSAIAGQKRLAEKFGIEGTPEVFLIHGEQQEVLRRAERLTTALEP